MVAYLKAIEQRLHRGSETVEVTFTAGHVARVMVVDENDADVLRWSFLPIAPVYRYTSAGIVDDSTEQLRPWEWPT